MTVKTNQTKHYIFAAVGGLIVAILIASTLTINLLREREIESWKIQLENLTLVLAEQTSQTMTSSQIALDSIADHVTALNIHNDAELRAQTGNRTFFQLLQNKISSLPQVDVASIVAANGEVINYTRSFPAQPINLSDRLYFQKQRDNPALGVFISMPLQNKGNGKWVFYVSRRINDAAGHFLGLVLVGISVDQFSDFYQRLGKNLGAGAAITLYRNDYSILARWPRKDETFGEKNLTGTTHKVVEEMKQSSAVIYSNGPRFSEGDAMVARLGAVRVLDKFPMIINLTITEDFFLANWRRITGFITLIAICSSIFLLLATLIILRSLRRQENSTMLLQKLSDELPGMLFQFQLFRDGRSQFTYANKEFLNVHGFKAGQIPIDGANIFALQHPDDAEKICVSITESAKQLTPWHLDYRLLIEDQEVRWKHGDARPQKQDDGSVLWHGYITDITERKHLDAALQRESEQNLALLRNASDGVHILDIQGNIIEASDSFCTMLGYTRDEIIGMNVTAWDAHFNSEEVIIKVRDLFSRAKRSQFETRHRRKDGSIFDVEISTFPLHTEGQQVLFNSSRDISSRKQMEDALQQQLLFSNAINNLSEILVEQDDAKFILENSVRIIGDALECDRTLIYEVRLDTSLIIGVSEWLNPQHPETPSSINTYPLAVFSGGALHMQQTRTWFSSQRDAVNPILSSDGSGEILHHKMHIESLLWYPFAFRNGNGYYALVLNQLYARKIWSREEIDFLDSVSHLINIEFEKIRLLDARKLADQQLRIAATAFESHEGMLITDATGAILQVNHAFTSITGYSAEEVIGKNPRILKSGRQSEDFYAAMWDTIKHNGSWEGELWNRRKNGEIYPEYMTITAVKDPSGSVTNYVGALTDSTQRQQAMSQLQSTAAALEQANVHIEEERAQLADRVQERTAQLQYANHAKDSFLATMSHEIRTPLGGLLGMMELLGLSQLNTQQREMLETARNSGQNLLRIVNDILDWSKIEAGKMELASRPANLAETLKSVVNTYAQLANDKALQLSVTIDPALGATHIFDPLRVSQILNNFTSNAIKFTQHGVVKISAQRLAQHDGYEQVKLSVQDHGVGIDTAQQSRLFQHYEQASADTARMYGGTGLGLAICRRLAELMDGTLSVVSAPGIGSTFSLTLNLAIADTTLLSNAPASLITAADSAAMTPTLADEPAEMTILIVDDQPINRTLLKQQLTLLGAQVDAAESGSPGLLLWQSKRYDLIITDCHMPEMDGYEFTRRIRAAEHQTGAAHIPIIAWTANVLAEEEVHCFTAGMDDMLTKPTDLNVLNAMLQKWLKRERVTRFTDTLHELQSNKESAAIDYDILQKFVTSRAAQIEMLQAFASQNQLDIAALHASLKGDDAIAMANAAHRIKGACRVVGATQLETICLRIETAAKEKNIASARACAAHELDAAVARIEAEIIKFIAA